MKRVTRRQANSVIDKILKQPVGKNCRKMRTYRGSVRNEPERLEKMGAKDMERKRLTREAQRQEIQKSNRQSEVCLKGKSTSFSKCCFSKLQLSISNLVIFLFFNKCLKSTLFQI